MTYADARFKLCLPFTLAQEAPFPNDWTNARNFSNDAHDAGGKTFMGIIQREYDVWRKAKCLPTRDIRIVTQDEGTEIYEDSYWLPHCPQLPRGLDLCLFDANVNEGCTEGTKILQAALGCANDGEWGPVTTQAVAAITHPQLIINTFTNRRQTVYRMMTGFQWFGDDWIKRSREIGAAALIMANAA